MTLWKSWPARAAAPAAAGSPSGTARSWPPFAVPGSGGGGQPIHDGEELAFARGRKLYALDAKAKLRYSHENPDIREIYSDFFGKPMSHKAHMLLHTEHWKNN